MTVDLSALGTRGNRSPASAYLRQHEPVALMKSPLQGKKWLVTRYQDVWLVLKDPRFSSDQRKGGSAGLQWLDQPWVPRIFRSVLHAMIAVDDPDHRRLRDLVHQAFTPRMIGRMAQRVETLSHELLDQAAKETEVDLISAFALPIPLTIIAEMMGVSKEDRMRFHHWVAPLVARQRTAVDLAPPRRQALSVVPFFSSAGRTAAQGASGRPRDGPGSSRDGQ
jgi:cytochrome P450